MNVYIKPSRYLTAAKREQLYNALRVFTDELYDGSKLPKTEVTISVRGIGMEDDMDGVCHIEEVYDNGKAKQIEVEIRGNRGLDHAVKCLAHEFVHVWQMTTGRYDLLTSSRHTDLAYADQPWEVEAFELEDPLYELWLKNS